jgi:excisionase family DNA binding protein
LTAIVALSPSGSVRVAKAASSGEPQLGARGEHLNAETGWPRTIQPTDEENMNEKDVIQNEPELLRVTEAAQLLALSRTKVYEMAEREEIPVLRIGTAVRIPRRKLLEWIEAQTIGGQL